MQIYIIPTYACNLNCNSCYSKKHQVSFPQYLSWADFIEIFAFLENRTSSVSFIGGEPTCWKFMNEAVLFLKNKGKRITLFSNGLFRLRAIPDLFVINGNNLLSLHIRDTIINNVTTYREKGSGIRLRFNIDQYFTASDISRAVRLSKNLADSVSISLLYPATLDKAVGKTIYDLCIELTSTSIPVKISRATPLCIFTEEQLEFLATSCNLKGQCPLPINSIVINPDGKTVQPCVELAIMRKLTDLATVSPRQAFTREIEKLRKLSNTHCSTCNHFKNGNCCGGCLYYKETTSSQ